MQTLPETHPDFQKKEAKPSDFDCPVCNQKMITWASSRGVFVQCNASTGCLPHENVFGFGDNEKAAHRIATEKYSK